MTGDITAISRLRMATDGQGVSTLISFYGCPLHCKYCVNESCHEEGRLRDGVPRAAYTPGELLEVLRKDEIYYLMTGGGVVFGGGEPLLQSAFIHEVCRLSPSGWKKRIETSLNVPLSCLEPVLQDMDEWIIDIKDMNGVIYEKYTEAGNEKVIRNLLVIRDAVDPEKIRVRIPQIRDYNTSEDVDKSVKWITNVMKVEPEVFSYTVFACR